MQSVLLPPKRCPKHPKYKAILPPRADDCQPCREMYLEAHGLVGLFKLEAARLRKRLVQYFDLNRNPFC